ncbi:hypothetical protein BLA29_011263, partial [Euroglyphus maynei]
KVAAKKLTPYSGDPIEYHTFRERICHYIVDNPQIRGNANKIMEIKDLLPTRDRYLIDSMNPNTSSMESILDELDEHYANANRIIPALVGRIRKAPFLSEKPLEKDWEAVMEVTIMIRNVLTKTDLAAEKRGLVGVLLQQIDRSHYKHIGNRRAITLEQIIEYLKIGLENERMAIAQIAASELTVKSNQTNNKPTNNTSNQFRKPTKNVMFASSNDG